MSRKVKVSYEMVSVMTAAQDYWVAKSELADVTKRYDEKLKTAHEKRQWIDTKRMALVVNQKKTWDEVMNTPDLTKADEEKADANVTALTIEKLEASKPYIERMASIASTIEKLEGLYPAYKLAMLNGDYYATGKVMLTKKSYTWVDTCFHDGIVKIMKEYGCGINAKSGKTIDDTMFVRIGGKPTKNGFEPFPKKQFVELFIDCVLQYAIDTKQM